MKYSAYDRDSGSGRPTHPKRPDEGEQQPEHKHQEQKHEHMYGRRRRDHELTRKDEWHCKLVGNKAKADYGASEPVEPAMTARQTKFHEAEKAYADSRAAVDPLLASARDSIKDLLKKLRCINEVDLELLDAAWNEVEVRLQHCAQHHGGPCLDDDCDFDEDVCDTDLKELLARQAHYNDRVTKAEALFDSLVGEPAALTARMAALQADVAEIVKDLGPDSATADPNLTYIKALVAEYHSKDEQIWAGFTYPYAYEDCLRHCLLCSFSGRHALTEIVGEIAVRQCKKTKRHELCAALKANLVAETQAEAEEMKEYKKRAESGSGS